MVSSNSRPFAHATAQAQAQRVPSLERQMKLTRICGTVSLVDGFNIPMRVDNNKGCSVADCPVDLGPNCTSSVLLSWMS